MFGVVIPYITGPLPAAQYAVDGSSLTTSSVPNTTRTLTGAKFYTSEYFPFGFHTLTVNVTTATDNAPYLFDYLAIDTTDPPASSSSSSSSATSSFSHTSSSSSPTSSDTALHAQGASTSNAPTGAIVGGVIGGVVLLAAIAIGAWWLWKKNRTYDQSSYAYAKTGQYGTRHPLAQSPLGLTRSLLHRRPRPRHPPLHVQHPRRVQLAWYARGPARPKPQPQPVALLGRRRSYGVDEWPPPNFASSLTALRVPRPGFHQSVTSAVAIAAHRSPSLSLRLLLLPAASIPITIPVSVSLLFCLATWIWIPTPPIALCHSRAPLLIARSRLLTTTSAAVRRGGAESCRSASRGPSLPRGWRV